MQGRRRARGQRGLSQAGGIVIKLLGLVILAALVAAYAILPPIDDPSLEGPDLARPVVAETPSADSERRVYWGDLHIHTSLSSDALSLIHISEPTRPY